MDRNSQAEQSRRTSGRIRSAPERYGETVSSEDYIEYSHSSHTRAGGSSSDSHSAHSSSSRGQSQSSVSHNSHAPQHNSHSTVAAAANASASIMNRVNYLNNAYTIAAAAAAQQPPPVNANIHRTASSNASNSSSSAAALRNMPVYAGYPGYSSRNNYVSSHGTSSSSSSAKRSIDFAMVSMNSFEIADVICPLTPFVENGMNERHVSYQQLAPYLNVMYKFYIRFCKFDNKRTAQLDCLPEYFLLSLNGENHHIETKYEKNSGNPYEITQLINDMQNITKAKDITFTVEYIEVPLEQISNFHYGIVAVKKVDLRYLIDSLPKSPYDSVRTIDSVKQLLHHDDELQMDGGEEANKLTVSLRCPYSSARLVHPARSKYCKHVTCFDLKSFIEMNEVSSKWRCPHCRDNIVATDLIVCGLLTRILKDAPAEAKDAYIDIMGRYTYDVERERIIPAAIRERYMQTVPVKAKLDLECITISDSDTEDESVKC